MPANRKTSLSRNLVRLATYRMQLPESRLYSLPFTRILPILYQQLMCTARHLIRYLAHRFRRMCGIHSPSNERSLDCNVDPPMTSIINLSTLTPRRRVGAYCTMLFLLSTGRLRAFITPCRDVYTTPSSPIQGTGITVLICEVREKVVDLGCPQGLA
jgi:hypothetical protein